jgi:2-polyprenyl-3-methyl-5-hydroxy-6-metoxy-1,4-benzoquinol methylase
MREIERIIGSYESPVIRLYARLRFAILRQYFLEEIGQYLPRRGSILDLGCGFGLFSLYFAAVEPGRRLLGVDLSERRIGYARASAARLGLANAEYQVGDALTWRCDQAFDAIYLLDMIHHLPRAEVPAFLERVRGRLRPGGILVVKDVEVRPAWKRAFTLLLDRLMVGRAPIHYWPARELAARLEALGFQVFQHRMKDILPYPHVLTLARLPAPEPG